MRQKSAKGVGLWLPPDIKRKYRQKWLCLWQDNDGFYLVNTNKEYLCAESWKRNDKNIEKKMKSAAKACGVENGNPIWLPGRKISDMEADDQMERLLEGKIPDEKEEILVAIEEEYVKRQGIPKE